MTYSSPSGARDAPVPARRRPIVGRRRALRYLMMFAASFLGAMAGYLVTSWFGQL